jgi:hypothetical protein
MMRAPEMTVAAADGDNGFGQLWVKKPTLRLSPYQLR